MNYLLAIICPPLAVAMATEESPAQMRRVLVSVCLSVCLCWVGGICHAWIVASEAR